MENQPQTALTVFLDQNHWIYLAQAYHNRSRGLGRRPLAEKIRSCVENGTCRIPLSINHLIEHLKAPDSARRRRLAEVFDVFSRGWFFAGPSNILPEELRRAVAQTFNTGLVFPRPEVFGRGIMFGFGSSARAALSPISSVSLSRFAELMRQPGSLFHMLTTTMEENRLRQNARISAGTTTNAKAAEDLRARRRPYELAIWRRAQAAQYTLEFQNQLRLALVVNGRSFEDFFGLGPAGMTEFFSRVPTLHVDSELLLYRDKQWTRKIVPNDLNDLWYLIEAVPYCDVVVTENFWRRGIQEQRLDRKYGTVVFSDLGELVQVLPL